MQAEKQPVDFPIRNGRTFHINNDPIGKKSLERYLQEGTITQDDADILNAYVLERQASRSLSQGRVNKILFSLLAWRKVAPAFRDAKITDIYSGIKRLNDPDVNDGKPYKQNTIHDIVVVLKPFYKWMIEEGISSVPLKKLNDIKRPSIDTNTKEATDLLTKEEREAMIHACTNSKDRAMLMMLYEGGFRVGEIGNLKWSDIEFTDQVVKIKTDFKTGKPRNVSLLASREYLAAWKADYPFDPTARDAVVFLTNRKTPATYASLYKQVIRLAERAGIKKHITPHIFRHTRITDLIKEGFSESVIKKMMWGNLTTDMFSTYLHLTGLDVENAILEHYGVVQENGKKKEKSLEPRQCPRCFLVNSPYTRFCPVCGMELTEQAGQEKGTTVTQLRQAKTEMTQEERIAAMEEEIRLLKEERARTAHV